MYQENGEPVSLKDGAFSVEAVHSDFDIREQVKALSRNSNGYAVARFNENTATQKS